MLSSFEERAVRGMPSLAWLLVSGCQERFVVFLWVKERWQAQLFREAWFLLWKDCAFKPFVDVHRK